MDMLWFYPPIPDAQSSQWRDQVVRTGSWIGFNLVVRRYVDNNVSCKGVTSDMTDHCHIDLHPHVLCTQLELVMEERAENAASAVARGMAADQDRGTCDWAGLSEAGGRRTIGSCVFPLGEVGMAKVVVMGRMVEKVGKVEGLREEAERARGNIAALVIRMTMCRVRGTGWERGIRSSHSFFDNVVLFHPPPTSSVGYASTFNLQVSALKDCASYVGTDPEESPYSTSSTPQLSLPYHRPETETWATYLVTRIQHDHIIKQSTSTNGPIRILDLCTGSGCISLLLFALLSVQSIPLQILGVDISLAAVKLAQRNLIHNISKGFLPASALSHIDFPQGDVFAKDRSWKECEYNIVVSNPPYISPVNYNRTTTRSVRNHEPKTALVPRFTSGSDEVVGDAFYPRIISIARDTKAKVLVMEVGDMHQARRVVQLVGKSKKWQKMEIWADGVLDHHPPQIVTNHLGAYIITIRGKGEARAVAVWARSGEGP
ncbi:MAG: hypothetical protein Q9192_007402 [Flavoplaca navasiana]